MHELKDFAPIGLNRDEALLAMGRAGARPNRVWQWLCTALVLSNLVTLAVVCWPRATVVQPDETRPVSDPVYPVVQPDPSSVMVLSQGMESTPANAGAMLSLPTLRAGSSGIE